MVEQKIPSSQPGSNRIRRGSQRASFISLRLSHPSVSRSGGLTAKPFLTLGKQRWIPQETSAEVMEPSKPKDIPFSLRDRHFVVLLQHICIYDPGISRETFCNFSALGNWTQVSCMPGKCSITPNYIPAYVPFSISENDIFAFPTGY